MRHQPHTAPSMYQPQQCVAGVTINQYIYLTLALGRLKVDILSTVEDDMSSFQRPRTTSNSTTTAQQENCMDLCETCRGPLGSSGILLWQRKTTPSMIIAIIACIYIFGFTVFIFQKGHKTYYLPFQSRYHSDCIAITTNERISHLNTVVLSGWFLPELFIWVNWN